MTEEKTDSAEELSFSSEREAKFQKLLESYPQRQAMLLPALHLAQEEFGYISVRAMEYVADRLDLPPSHVLSVVTFYTMFNRQPVGEKQIHVCTCAPCAVQGSDELVRHLEKRLEVKLGQTTSDRKFTLGRAECLASCDTGPMLECNGNYYENLTPETLDKLIDAWSKGEDPTPNRERVKE